VNSHDRSAVIDAVPIDRATFRNSFVEELRGEHSGNSRPRQVPGYCYSAVAPTPCATLACWPGPTTSPPS
jgi:hypothetical protein